MMVETHPKLIILEFLLLGRLTFLANLLMPNAGNLQLLKKAKHINWLFRLNL